MLTIMESSIAVPAPIVAPEIWSIIFDKVYTDWIEDRNDFSTNDLFTCSKVCVTFQNVLEPTKTLWLFQEVVPILSTYLGYDNLTDGQPILRCRQVCKGWKRAVDSYLESHDIFAHATMEHGRDRLVYSTALSAPIWNTLRCNPVPMCSLITSDNISDFTKEMAICRKNPFPGKSLYLKSPHLFNMARDVVEEFWNLDVERLLSNFGKFITVLRIDLCESSEESGISPQAYRERVRNCLIHVPNLKRLSVSGHLNEPILGRTEALEDWVEVDSQPLPHLKSVAFSHGGHNGYSLPFSLQYKICSTYFHQLRSLKLSIIDSNLIQADLSRIPEGCLPNLEVLELEILFSCHLYQVFHLASNSTKLQCLTIQIGTTSRNEGNEGENDDDDTEEEDNNMELFEMVDNVELHEILTLAHDMFCKSIETLIIIVGSPMRNKCEASEQDLQILKGFPKLKYLHIEGFFLEMMEILECLPPTLEYLILDGFFSACVDDKGGRKMIPGISLDFPNESHIYRGGLWEKLTKLRWLLVTCHINGRTKFLRRNVRLFSRCSTYSVFMYRRENWENVVKKTLNE